MGGIAYVSKQELAVLFRIFDHLSDRGLRNMMNQYGWTSEEIDTWMATKARLRRSLEGQ